MTFAGNFFTEEMERQSRYENYDTGTKTALSQGKVHCSEGSRLE